MADRALPRPALAVLAAGALLLGGGLPTAPAAAQDSVTGPLRFEVADDGLLDVETSGRYLDTLEARWAGSGPVLVNELSFDDYVAGIAEMPARWPMEALKAQAVAARTYGWNVLRTSSYDGYDICATVACQVFRGADAIAASATGDRWRQAVDETSGEVLVDANGEPILARYFSTSGGRTYANEEAFPSSGARDYLVSVEDPYDEVSPFHRWSVTFTREEFDDILSRGDTLAAAVPVAEVERIGAIDDPGARLAVTGIDGTRVEVGARDFQRFVSSVAPDRHPARFPPLRADGDGLLPSTIPTSRFSVRLTDEAVVIDGQGWGHGVGLGQYGARGRAEEGHDYREILAAYYNGIEPQTVASLPPRVRVGLPMPGDLRIRGDHPVRITAGDDVIEEAALGTWGVTPVSDGGWALQPPAGHDEQLRMGVAESADGIATFQDAVTIRADVNKPVILYLEVTDTAGETTLDRSLGVVDAGSQAAVWRLDAADGSPAPPGDYRVALVGEDHRGAREETAIEVTLPLETTDAADDAASDDLPSTGTNSVSAFRTPAIALAVGALSLAAVLVTRRRR